jgi:hypothetical protein
MRRQWNGNEIGWAGRELLPSAFFGESGGIAYRLNGHGISTRTTGKEG